MHINKLILKTNNVEKQKEFYSNVLGLELIKNNENYFEVQVGTSVLGFEYSEKFTPYHFAFNIPSHQEEGALKWLKARTKIISYLTQKIIWLSNFNAKAIYFYDADGNILELIARRKLKIESHKQFSSQSILNISEIAIATDDINSKIPILKELGLPLHSGDTNRFCSFGNDKGLFIIANNTIKKTWFPTKDKTHPSPFKIDFTNMKGERHLVEYKENILSHH